jgi:hypothetical protein
LQICAESVNIKKKNSSKRPHDIPDKFTTAGKKVLSKSDSNRVSDIDPVLLRKVIHNAYNLPEFEILCRDLGLSYDDIRGSTFETKILEFIEWHRRRRRYAVLVLKILDDHPYLSSVLGIDQI